LSSDETRKYFAPSVVSAVRAEKRTQRHKSSDIYDIGLLCIVAVTDVTERLWKTP